MVSLVNVINGFARGVLTLAVRLGGCVDRTGRAGRHTRAEYVPMGPTVRLQPDDTDGRLGL